MGFSNPLVSKGGSLVYPSIHSPDYVAGTSGWSCNKDGSAEFNNVVIRNGQIVSGLALWYSTTPGAANKLVSSISAVDGIDPYGNKILSGVTDYFYDGALAVATQINYNVINFWTGTTQTSGYTLRNFIAYQRGVNDQIEIGGQVTIDGNTILNNGITSYALNAFTTYTPTVTNDGTTTYTVKTGWWQRIGKMVFFTAYIVWGAAGSGANPVSVTTPTNIDRSTRQVIGAHFEGASAKAGHMAAVTFTGGSANVIDRIRAGTGGTTNLTGADIANGDILVIEGWYREA